MTFQFEEPGSGGTRWTETEAQNRRLIVVPTAHLSGIPTTNYGLKDPIQVNVVDLETGEAKFGVMWFSSVLVGEFKHKIGKLLLGFVSKQPTRNGNQGWAFSSLATHEETANLARSWLSQNPGFLETCEGDVRQAQQEAAQRQAQPQQVPQQGGWQQQAPPPWQTPQQQAPQWQQPQQPSGPPAPPQAPAWMQQQAPAAQPPTQAPQQQAQPQWLVQQAQQQQAPAQPPGGTPAWMQQRQQPAPAPPPPLPPQTPEDMWPQQQAPQQQAPPQAAVQQPQQQAPSSMLDAIRGQREAAQEGQQQQFPF